MDKKKISFEQIAMKMERERFFRAREKSSGRKRVPAKQIPMKHIREWKEIFVRRDA